MKKFFKWEQQPEGEIPIHASGWFLGYYFEFYAAQHFAEIHFYNGNELIFWHTLSRKNTDLSLSYCRRLIYKGCLIFILKG